MRLAFIVMALLNLAFFAWQYPKDGDWQTAAAPKRPANDKGDQGSIRLLHELNGTKKSSLDTPADAAVKPVSLTRPAEAAPARKPSVRQQRLQEILAEHKCYSVGPFFSRDAGERIATRIEGAGAYTKLRTAENQENLRYWVTYVAQNAHAARQTYNDLQGKGLRDISMMPGDSDANIVSLGLFRGESTANRRMEEIRRLGYVPTVKKQFSSRTAFWVDAEEDPKQPITSSAWKKILEFSDEAQQTLVACP